MVTLKVRRLIHVVLVLCVAFSPIAAGGRTSKGVTSDRPLTVMTRNMFIGTDFGPILGATSFDGFLVAVANAYLDVQQSNIPERAAAVADEIEAKQPHLVGLQEVSIWRTGPLGGPATTVTYDALQSLLDELAGRGLSYTPIAILTEFQAEAPSALGINIGFTDRDVILARADLATSGLKLSNVQAQHFATNFSFTSPILGALTVPRGWISVDGKVRGKQFRFVSAHLESFHPGVQAVQASELIFGPANTELPVVIAGDLNTESASGDPAQNAGYQIILGAGFRDAWTASNPSDPGFTWPLHLDDPFTSVAPFQRLDLILTRGDLDVLSSELSGHTSANRTASGLWPSDHAGVISSINLKTSAAKLNATVTSSNSFAHSVKQPLGIYASSFAEMAQATSEGRVVFKRVDLASPNQAGNGIYIMDDNGANVRRLVSNGFEPALSADGKKLAFVTGQAPSGCNNHELNIMPSIFGTDWRPLTNVCGYDQHPAWSPDGTSIAFWSDRDAGDGLYVMNADGSAQTRILKTSNIQRQIESPHWSPDGTRIAFVGYNLGTGEADVFVVNANGTNPVNVTNTPALSEVAPSWSRDNNKIAYIRVTSSDNSQIYTMNANGSNQIPLTSLSLTGLGISLGLGELKLTWSPDGTRLAFMDVGNSLDIFAVNADGSNRVPLTNTADNDTYPDWQVAAPAPTTNPIDSTEFFVRQHYIDFLNREPDPAGFAAWQNVINNCPTGDTTCDRIHVSSAFFRSPEFQERGYFVYRFYSVSLGRKPDYAEFIPDLAKVSGFLSDAELEAAKVAFINEFMSRPAFVTIYNGLNDTQYVDTLLATAQVTSPHRDFWIAALGNGTRTRATVLRDISESPGVYNKYFNQAFVVMQYFGYLRRDPDALYVNWIQVLDTTGDFRGMVNGFMNSLEYRFRFGP